MNERELTEQLRREAFTRIYAWQDAPHAEYPPHVHPVETAHVVLQGEIAITMDGRTRTYHSGQRFDVPAGAVHAARIGPQGCRYLIGEKEPA